MSKQVLYLYSTDACHLCEQALDILRQCNFDGDVVVRDIMDQPQWLGSYQLRIPVLQYANHELDWPFSVAEVQQFLNRQNANSV